MSLNRARALHSAQGWLEQLLSGDPHRQFEMIATAVFMTTALFALIAPDWPLIGMNVACALTAVLLLCLHAKRPSWRVRLTWWLWLAIHLTAINGVIWQGGIWSMAMGYFFASSVGMLMMIDVRAFLVSTGITVLTVLGLTWVESQGWIGTSVVSPNNLLWPMTLFSSLLMAFIMLPLVAHHTQRRIARRLKKDNQALQEAQEQLRHQHRMQEQFVASVSHELRTPMNAIMGFLQTIDRDSQMPPEEVEMTDLMAHSAQQLLLRINELLDFSQLQAGKLRIRPQPMNLRRDIQRVVQPFEDDLGDRPVQLHTQVHEAVPEWVMGDPERLGQILHNLLSNAVKFTPRGEITVSARVQGEQLRLEVSDTGPGIQEDELERIFNRLSNITSRTRREMGGTGLGLSIAKALVELMGGHMQVQSRLGHGSTFSVLWPLELTQAPRSEHAAASAQEAAQQARGRVLIVDDSPVNRLVAQNLLRTELPQIDILEAEDATTALGMLREESIDVVLMDVVMPGMSGIEATSAISREFGSQAPVVLGLTADTSEDVHAQCHDAGMAAIIHKPFDRHSLAQPVVRALQLHQVSA